MKYRIYHKILKVTIMCSLAAPFIHGAVQEKINAALVTIDAQVNHLYGAVAGSKAVIEALIKENTMLKQQLAQKNQQTSQVAATNPSIIMQQNEKLRLELQQLSSSNKALLQEKQRWIEDRGKIIKDGQALVTRYQQALVEIQRLQALLPPQSRR